MENNSAINAWHRTALPSGRLDSFTLSQASGAERRQPDQVVTGNSLPPQTTPDAAVVSMGEHNILWS